MLRKTFIMAGVIAATTLFTGCTTLFNKTETVKVMSYNIRHGAGMDNKLDLERTAAVINKQAPDFIGLQEVDNKCGRSQKVDQTTELGKLTQMEGTFGKFMNLQGGQYGMATLSRLPLVSSEVVKLPPAKHEPRCAVLNVVKLKSGVELAIANVHFDWLKDQEQRRVEQAATLLKRIDALKLPAIILGDFNTTPDSDTLKFFKDNGFVFMDKGEDNLTFQGSGEPIVEIDHIIYRSSEKVALKGISIDVLEEKITSDHRPVVAEISVEIN